MRVSEANGNCTILNYTVTNSSFVYGKAIEVDAVHNLHLFNSTFSFNRLQNQNFIMLNQVIKGLVENLYYYNFTKSSDKSRFGFSFQTLTLSKNES